MEEKLFRQIKSMIESTGGVKSCIIYPFGYIGMQVKEVLNTIYGVQESFLVDDNLSIYNRNIYNTKLFEKIDCKEFIVFLSSTNISIFDILKKNVERYFPQKNIYCLESMTDRGKKEETFECSTSIGKYSYGPICRNHLFIESIGAFCSFAYGVEVVQNHEMRYLTTHDMIYLGQHYKDKKVPFDAWEGQPWYFPGVQPKDCVTKAKRSKIGNDVWLGRNVLITNGANIGNGVIAGAGAVITKDIPAYAVVGGVPAKILRYRYTPEQVEELNRIQWWNWSDEMIRDRYDDFYLPIEEFIYKYKKY